MHCGNFPDMYEVHFPKKKKKKKKKKEELNPFFRKTFFMSYAPGNFFSE